MLFRVLGPALSALTFSVAYAFIEYYLIKDTTLGYSPVLFSLIYPYHFAMAAVFGLATYSLLRWRIRTKELVPSLILACALFSSMLAIEDFTWFALRATAPVENDLNAGKLVLPGEWTTQFMGSVNAHFTAIPNWYFLSLGFLVTAYVAMRERKQLAALAST